MEGCGWVGVALDVTVTSIFLSYKLDEELGWEFAVVSGACMFVSECAAKRM